jgi:hypothetical protein
MSVLVEAYEPRIAVVHIVWKPFGLGVFRCFLDSYVRYNAGKTHELVLLFKGFDNESDSKEYLLLLLGIEHRRLYIADCGYDIGAYLNAAKIVSADYYCFLNSKSVLLTSDWLLKLYSHARSRAVGIVGATASWESLYTDHIRECVFPSPGSSHLRHALRRSVINKLRYRYYYPPFPNWHVRTNAFMLRSATLQLISIRAMRSRRDTSRFENGRNGITRQLMRMRLIPLVVGRNGEAYEYMHWAASNTFWRGAQENLMISDNQTQLYASADESVRAKLSAKAWGKH